MRLLIFLGLLVITSGCANLILHDRDSTGTTTGKVAARVLLAPITLGISEMAIHEARMHEECADRGLVYFPAPLASGGCGVPTNQGNNLAMFGVGAALINGMNQGFNNMRLPVSAPIQSVQPQVHRPLHCTTYTLGTQTSTTCY